jgi:hypothetical protein
VVAGYRVACISAFQNGAVLVFKIVRRKRMKHLSRAEIAIIKARILRGDRYSDIASDYRINQGRIADLKFGRIFRDVQPADLR